MTQPMIQSGTANVGMNYGTHKQAFTVNFPKPFAGRPVVTANAMADTTRHTDTFAVTITAASTTSFTVNIHRVDHATSGWGQNLRLNWIAFAGG